MRNARTGMPAEAGVLQILHQRVDKIPKVVPAGLDPGPNVRHWAMLGRICPEGGETVLTIGPHPCPPAVGGGWFNRLSAAWVCVSQTTVFDTYTAQRGYFGSIDFSQPERGPNIGQHARALHPKKDFSTSGQDPAAHHCGRSPAYEAIYRCACLAGRGPARDDPSWQPYAAASRHGVQRPAGNVPAGHGRQVSAIITTETREVGAGSGAPDFTREASAGRVSLADYHEREHVLLVLLASVDLSRGSAACGSTTCGKFSRFCERKSRHAN